MAQSLSHPRHWPSWLVVGLVRALGMLPFPLLWALGTAIGQAGWFVGGPRRRVALANLALCFPERSTQQRRRMGRRHFGWLGVAAFTQGVVWGASRTRLARLVRIRGRERVDQALADGGNLIILVPHFVGLELGGAAFTALVHSGLYMYQRIRNPVIDAVMRASRTRFGGVPVERQDDLRGMVRIIRGGTPFFYLPDQDAGRRGVFAPFCGIQASTVGTLGRFARLADARVIPLYARYLPWGRGLEVIFDPPLEPFPCGDPAADAVHMNRVIEARVRDWPEQYFWVHRRFKTRPVGEPLIYPKRTRKRR